MRIDLSPDQEAFIRQAIQDGRVKSTQDAIREALELWESRERRRAEILAAVSAAETSLARGEGLTATESSLQSLADEVKRRGRARLESGR